MSEFCCPQLITIDLSPIICPDNKCQPLINGTPLYHDDDHLNAEGSRVLALKYLETQASFRLKEKLREIKLERAKLDEK